MFAPAAPSLAVLTPVLLALLIGCGSSQTPDAAAEDPAAAGSATAEVPGDVPDACTFFPRAELEERLGWELREGEREELPTGSKCDFEMPSGMNITRTFPDPPLPRSVDFHSITVQTYTSRAESFGEYRQHLGAAAEHVPGLGDDAYFYGRDMLYVRAGNRAFSLRLYTNASSDGDWAKVRQVMLELGRTGAERLGS